ncbi:MAG: lasso peptide biosynthesis B2 protein [Nitrospira sp.]|nr:lasso peptide biosynthesis B2 protein [Nitrospira sp.]
MKRVVRKYWMLLQVAVIVSRIRLRLRGENLPAVLKRLAPGALSGTPDSSRFEDLVYYVDRWLQLFPYNAKGNCFPRSLALYWFATRSGYSVSFHCGVRKDGSGLDGHAWLTLDRQPFHEPGQHWQRFTVTYSFPSDQPVNRGQAPPVCPRNGTTAAV